MYHTNTLILLLQYQELKTPPGTGYKGEKEESPIIFLIKKFYPG